MFSYYTPTKIFFGVNAIRKLGDIVKIFGSKCLLVTTKNIEPLSSVFESVKTELSRQGLSVMHFDKVISDPSVELVVEGIALAKQWKPDVVVAIGGGSSIDTAKSIALLQGLKSLDWDEIFMRFSNPFQAEDGVSINNIPLISIPTTAGTGSEVTQAAVLTSKNSKNTIFHPKNLSYAAILDPCLLLSLPERIVASTGFDCFSHAFESYCSSHASPISKLLAMESLKICLDTLPRAVETPGDIKWQSSMMYAQLLAGISLSNAGAGIQHPISEVIGSITGIPHGEALALIYPEVVEYYEKQHLSEWEEIKTLFPGGNISAGIIQLLTKIHLYRRLSDYHVEEPQILEIRDTSIIRSLTEKNQDLMKLLFDKMKER